MRRADRRNSNQNRMPCHAYYLCICYRTFAFRYLPRSCRQLRRRGLHLRHRAGYRLGPVDQARADAILQSYQCGNDLSGLYGSGPQALVSDTFTKLQDRELKPNTLLTAGLADQLLTEALPGRIKPPASFLAASRPAPPLPSSISQP